MGAELSPGSRQGWQSHRSSCCPGWGSSSQAACAAQVPLFKSLAGPWRPLQAALPLTDQLRDRLDVSFPHPAGPSITRADSWPPAPVQGAKTPSSMFADSASESRPAAPHGREAGAAKAAKSLQAPHGRERTDALGSLLPPGSSAATWARAACTRH